MIKLDIAFQAAALILALCMSVIRVKQKKIGVPKEYAFTACMSFCLVWQVVDIIARYAVFSETPEKDAVHIFAKISLVLLIFYISAAILYFVHIIFNGKQVKTLSMLTVYAAIAAAIVIFVLDISHNIIPYGAAFSGAAYSFACIYACLVIVAITAAAIIKRNEFSNIGLVAVCVWAFLCVLGIALECISKVLMCMSIFSALGLFAVLVMTKKTAGLHARKIRLFNYDDFTEYMDFSFSRKKSDAFIYIYLYSDSKDYSKSMVMSSAAEELISELIPKRKAAGFRFNVNEYAICLRGHGITELTFALKDAFDDRIKELGFADRFSVIEIADANILAAGSFENLMAIVESKKKEEKIFANTASVAIIDMDAVEKLNKEMSALQSIEYALSNDKIELVYQPVYSLEKNGIVSAEALVRVKNENDENMLPGEFIPVAEKYGKMKEFDNFVMKKAIEFFIEAVKTNERLEDISINISAKQIEKNDFINSMIDIVADHRISPDCICVEITDMNSIKDKKAFTANIERLVSFGIKLSVTGYGSEKSSLSYVSELPVDMLRFDRRFIWDAAKDERVRTVLFSSVEIVKELKKTVVAVGIETEEQFNMMKESGVSLLQGIYMSRPLNEASFIQLLSEGGGAGI